LENKGYNFFRAWIVVFEFTDEYLLEFGFDLLDDAFRVVRGDHFVLLAVDQQNWDPHTDLAIEVYPEGRVLRTETRIEDVGEGRFDVVDGNVHEETWN
jgi:hypothetical protein